MVASGNAHAASKPQQRQVVAPISVPLTYTVKEAEGGREIHTPMMQAQVGQEKVLFILDTGATDPIFTMDLTAPTMRVRAFQLLQARRHFAVRSAASSKL